MTISYGIGVIICYIILINVVDIRVEGDSLLFGVYALFWPIIGPFVLIVALEKFVGRRMGEDDERDCNGT